jgi:hypothetical protein
MKTPQAGTSHGSSAAHENLLYLLAEIERAIERGTIQWTPDTAKEFQRRLGKLFIALDALCTSRPVH